LCVHDIGLGASRRHAKETDGVVYTHGAERMVCINDGTDKATNLSATLSALSDILTAAIFSEDWSGLLRCWLR
jgi:hypothetical protein